MALTTLSHNKRKMVHFDSDTVNILVDNCYTRSITNTLEDFIDIPSDASVKIKGYNGVSTKPNKVGTVQWKWDDDDGNAHTFHIPGTFYSPDAETRLLSPQHWASTLTVDRSTKCTTYHDAIVLQWGHHKRTIPISHRTNNVGILTTSPGNIKYDTLYDQTLQEYPLLAFPTSVDLHIITDEETENQQGIPMDRPTKATTQNIMESTIKEGIQDTTQGANEPIRIAFKEPEQKEQNIEQPTYEDERHEYMSWHYRLNHASQRIMIRMAHQKQLPPFITKILKKMDKIKGKPAFCNDCYCAHACRTPWRSKQGREKKPNRRLRLKPGEVVSVDQLESSTLGFL